MELQPLIDIVDKLLPALRINLDQAYKEWMDGKIAKGAFEYVRVRTLNAEALHEHRLKIEQLPEYCYRMLAINTIDIRCAVRDGYCGQELFDEWLELYKSVGFTDTHRLFDFPIQPITSNDNG